MSHLNIFEIVNVFLRTSMVHTSQLKNLRCGHGSALGIEVLNYLDSFQNFRFIIYILFTLKAS